MPKHPRFVERDRILAELGFAHYGQYLRSSLWRNIRIRIRLRDHNRCILCRGGSPDVHHLTYTRDVLLGRPWALTDLACLCRRCHHKEEVRLWGTAPGMDSPDPVLRKACELRRPQFKSKTDRLQACGYARQAAEERKRARAERMRTWAKLCSPWLLPTMREKMLGRGDWPKYPAQVEYVHLPAPVART